MSNTMPCSLMPSLEPMEDIGAKRRRGGMMAVERALAGYGEALERKRDRDGVVDFRNRCIEELRSGDN